MYPLLSCDAGPVFVRIAKPSHNTPCEWLLMTRHVVDINLAYKITKRKLYTNVEYNFHHHCTYLTLWAVFLFSANFGFCHSIDEHAVSTNIFSGLSFRNTQRVWVFRVWVFWVRVFQVWVFETPEGLTISGLGLSFRVLSFQDTRLSTQESTTTCKTSFLPRCCPSNERENKALLWRIQEKRSSMKRNIIFFKWKLAGTYTTDQCIKITMNYTVKPVGLISAALSCLVYVPPRKETAGRMSGHPCPWCHRKKINLWVLGCLGWRIFARKSNMRRPFVQNEVD